MEKKEKIIVVGGGIAGLEASSQLSAMGYHVTLLEKKEKIGGHVLNWYKLFPSQREASDVIDYLKKNIEQSHVNVVCNVEIIDITKEENNFIVILKSGDKYKADAILLSTGFDIFNARIKEEYGYGIYDNVITSVELEEKFKQGKEILMSNGKVPGRIGFIHCVGSRDEKVGNTYCSQVCCVTAVKQAIEIRQKLPRTEVYCFYMDMRMFGLQFEDLYKESQEKWSVNYIRGRLSEACENMDGTILIKVEDTLSGRPLKMTVDLLVLMVGFIPSEGTRKIGRMLNLDFTMDEFIKPSDEHIYMNITNVPGVFVSGTCIAPKTIMDTFADARAAALMISKYLEDKHKKNIII